MQPFAYCLRLIDITNYLNEKNMNMRGFIGMITLFVSIRRNAPFTL